MAAPHKCPGATGVLPIGWHRVTWTANGRPRYVVTEEAGAAIETLISDVAIEHWMPQ